MKFCWSTLRVSNMSESLKFYEDIVGLKVISRFPAGPNMEIAFLGEGETKVELLCDENNKGINVGDDISWGFEVESLDDMMSLVKEKGIAIESGPFQPNPQTKFFFVRDPNGLKIQFVEMN
ncbi:MAG: VOC family protein [Anaerovoracaceae bacterium]